MAKYQLKIQLLSDLCVSDGGVYNSMIDVECCYDENGFPFIPAKRIKGCLRECAQELNDWGKNIDIDGIFGEEGRSRKGSSEKRAQIRIGNAFLEESEARRKEILACPGNILFHPQHILNSFTSLRTQTAISQETGIADPHSLRTMRVVNKGLVFTAEVEMPASAFESVKSCCAVLHQMGIARTRGFGDVVVTISPVDLKDGKNAAGRDSSYTHDSTYTHAELVPSADCLEYEITLEEPLICKSIAGGEARTLDYIEGSKILGLIMERIKRQAEGQAAAERFLEDGALRCSNAYIGIGGARFTEVPAYIYSIKNNKEDFVDRRIRRQNPEGIQLSQMKHCYVLREGKKLFVMDVNVEERYHHRRAEDKSIGRAVPGGDSSDFYQMSAIMAGQKFYGSIHGSKQQIKTAYMCLTEDQTAHLGYGRSAEYGKVRIRVTGTCCSEDRDNAAGSISAAELVVKLNSPAVIYNEKAMCSVHNEDLIEEILYEMGIGRSDLLDYEVYANFTTIGGFNVTWERRKPTVPAFDKGTAVCLKLKKSIRVPETLFIGERRTEGYGEASVISADSYLMKVADTASDPASGPSLNSDDPERALNLVRSGSIISCDPLSAAESLQEDVKGQNVEKKQEGVKDRNAETKQENVEGQEDVKGQEKEKGQPQKTPDKTVLIKPGSLGEILADRIFLTWLGAVAREKAPSVFQAAPEKYRPTISNMLTGFNDYSEISQVEKMVEARYDKSSESKEEKLRFALGILGAARTGFGKAKEKFCAEHGISEWDWTPEAESRYQLAYLRGLLIAMKLHIRGTQNKKQEG